MIQLYKLSPYDKFKIILSEQNGVKRYSQDQNGEDVILIFSHTDGSYCKCWYYGELHNIPATTIIEVVTL